MVVPFTEIPQFFKQAFCPLVLCRFFCTICPLRRITADDMASQNMHWSLLIFVKQYIQPWPVCFLKGCKIVGCAHALVFLGDIFASPRRFPRESHAWCHAALTEIEEWPKLVVTDHVTCLAPVNYSVITWSFSPNYSGASVVAPYLGYQRSVCNY